jgi:hypothetical protein
MTSTPWQSYSWLVDQVVNTRKQIRRMWASLTIFHYTFFQVFQTACPPSFDSQPLPLYVHATTPHFSHITCLNSGQPNYDVRSCFSTTETFFRPQHSRNPYHEKLFRYHRCPRTKLRCSTVSTVSTVQFDSALRRIWRAGWVLPIMIRRRNTAAEARIHCRRETM